MSGAALSLYPHPSSSPLFCHLIFYIAYRLPSNKTAHISIFISHPCYLLLFSVTHPIPSCAREVKEDEEEKKTMHTNVQNKKGASHFFFNKIIIL